jgi:hypothetical protein
MTEKRVSQISPTAKDEDLTTQKQGHNTPSLFVVKTMMFRCSILLLSFAAVHVSGQTEGSINQPDPNEPCSVCFSGDAPLIEPTFKWFQGVTDMTCSDIVTAVFDAAILQGNTVCKDYQLRAFQMGCCSSPPYEYCPVCPDGSAFERSNEVPIGTGSGTPPTCAENLYRVASYNALFTPGTCADTVIQRGAFYCGCPNVEQQCFLCPDESNPENPERGDGWVTGSNCEGLEFLFSLYNTEECDGLRNNYGVDFAHFCKCPNYEKTSDAKCVMCADGLANPNFVYTESPFTRTCQQAVDFSESITRENICLAQMNDVIAKGCKCNGGSGPTFKEEAKKDGAVGMTASFSMIAAGVLALNTLIA